MLSIYMIIIYRVSVVTVHFKCCKEIKEVVQLVDGISGM